MPGISIAVEATTHICAAEFFDPIPTVWHLLLVIFTWSTRLLSSRRPSASHEDHRFVNQTP